MTHKLRSAIEAVLEHGNASAMADLREVYDTSRASMTETAKRIEFLEDCLVSGVSKREAARILVVHDPRIGQRTAETLVYLNFSGEYQTTKRGQRKPVSTETTSEVVLPVADINDDESIL